MSKEVTDIAVVICTYSEGRWNDLVQAVGSVLRQTRPARDLVVVVDHNPGLLSRVRHEFPGLTAVENWQSPGLSGARNTGLASTNASVIAFLDDDASAAPDWLERLEPGYQDTRVLGVGGFVAPVWQAGRPGSRKSSIGWWAAATAACRKRRAKFATCLDAICPSAARSSRWSAGF